MCKECLKGQIDYNNIQSIKDALMNINRPFIHDLWISSGEESVAKNSDHFGLYMKTLALKDFKYLTWKDSNEGKIQEQVKLTSESKQQTTDVSNELDRTNKEDVIRMVGYDPFEFEHESDKRNLYNKLVDFLDDSTLEDSFKLPAVIEIVKTFNQLDKINSALSLATSNITSVTDNAGGIKSLIDSKEKMLKSVLALAKDNGISVNHNNNKSKGSGTLSGVIKQLQEKGFEEAEVNVFNIETCEGMRQVADISNQSIIKQLQFDENDYTSMIIDQRK